MLRDHGHDAYVLQLGLDPNDSLVKESTWSSPIFEISEGHLFSAVPIPSEKYQRTCLGYHFFLKKYVAKFREMFLVAVDLWGLPDVIHAHVSLPGGFIASVIGKEFNIPVIVQEHYSGFESDAKFWWRVGKFARDMGENIDGFYAVSPGFAARIKATKIIHVDGVLPNPINTELFNFSKKKKAVGVFKIVTAGNLCALKGSDILINALRLIPPGIHWEAFFCGSFNNKESYAHLLNDHNLIGKVHFLGKVQQEELAELYSTADLYVVSSRSETANVSMLEAMACGAPVLTTECGGPETLIDETVGVKIPRNNPLEMNKEIMKFILGEYRFNRLNLREFILKNYSTNSVIQKVISAYHLAIYRKRYKNNI